MSSKNDITGDRLISRPNSDKFNENFDHIFNSTKQMRNNAEVCGHCFIKRTAIDADRLYRCPSCGSEVWIG